MALVLGSKSDKRSLTYIPNKIECKKCTNMV